MALSKDITPLIGLTYNIDSSPRIDLPEHTHSVDCRLLWQKYYHLRFGINLPIGLWSEEAFLDENLFRHLQPNEKLIEGDTYFFGKKNDLPKSFHLAIFTGEWYQQDPLLIHASAFNGKTVTLDPLSKIIKTPQHAQIMGIKRLRPDLFQAHILPVVYNNAK